MKSKNDLHLKLTMAIVICIFLVPTIAFSQTQVGSTIVGEMPFDKLGRDVGISDDGSKVIVGLEGSDSSCFDCGKVKVFTLINGDWELLGQEINGNLGVGLGSSVQISGDGNTIACGGFLGNPELVRVYRFDGQIWQPLGSDLNGDEINSGYGFSTSLSKNGNTIIIGARNDNELATAGGKVIVYYFDGSNWLVKGQIFRGSEDQDRLGRSCSISASGDTIAFSTEGYDGFEEDIGKVESYSFANGEWIKFGGELIGEKEDDFFGAEISLSESGNILAVGSRFGGYVKTFILVNNEWLQRGQTLTNPSENSRYSWFLDLSSDGNWLGVSDPFFNNKAGIAHIYNYANNNWENVSGDINGTQEDDLLGAVGVSNQGLKWILGTSKADTNGEDSGLAVVQELNNENTASSNETIKPIRVYPNPSYGVINIQIDQLEKINYSLSDIYGNIQLSGILNHNKLYTNNIKSGLYFLNIDNINTFSVLIMNK